MLPSLFKSGKNLSATDLSSIAVDMHSHLIPGIDDGVKTVDEAIPLIRRFFQLGYRKLIITPHINSRFPNSSKRIRSGLQQLRLAVEEARIPIILEAAAEYQLEEGFGKLLEANDFLTFGNQQLLIELSYFLPPPDLSEILYQLQSSGYNLILAHAERYGYWHRDLSKLESLLDREVALQVNLNSFSGYFGADVRNAARKIVARAWVTYAGSDVHNALYMENFIRGAQDKYARQLMESGLLKNHLLL